MSEPTPLDRPDAQSALERLERSRQALQARLRLDGLDAAASASGASASSGASLRSRLLSLLPLRVTMRWRLASALANELLRPSAQQRPLALLAAALSAGAMAVLLRPWRWLPGLGLGLGWRGLLLALWRFSRA